MRLLNMREMTQVRWQKLTEWPLALAAVLFLVAYAWQVLTNQAGRGETAADVVLSAIWVIFAVDYVVNLALAPARWRWFFSHLHEFLIVALPFLRPLRLLRLIALVSILQRAAGSALRGRIVLYATGSSVLLVTVAALAMLDVERNAPGSTITSFGDALWWAAVTITTVGYGDLSPVTMPGRLIAVGIMIAGIALLGTVTAMLASWFLEKVEATDEKVEAITQREVADLAGEIALLRELILADRTLERPPLSDSGVTTDSRP